MTRRQPQAYVWCPFCSWFANKKGPVLGQYGAFRLSLKQLLDAAQDVPQRGQRQDNQPHYGQNTHWTWRLTHRAPFRLGSN